MGPKARRSTGNVGHGGTCYTSEFFASKVIDRKEDSHSETAAKEKDCSTKTEEENLDK